MAQPLSLYELFAEIPDPRSRQGRRHPLPAVLSLMVVAMLGGARSLQAIEQFARDRGEDFARLLGFTHWPTPCKGMLSDTLRDLEPSLIERQIGRWLGDWADWQSVALDGKTARGSAEGDLPGVHLLAAYAHEAGHAIGQMAVNAKTNEHKQALQLLNVIPLEGKVVTGDAMYCQRDLSEQILKKGVITSGRSKTISRS